MQETKKKKKIDWDKTIDITHTTFSKAIKKLLLESYLDGNLTLDEIESAKDFLKMKPELSTSKNLSDLISNLEVEVLVREDETKRKI